MESSVNDGSSFSAIHILYSIIIMRLQNGMAKNGKTRRNIFIFDDRTHLLLLVCRVFLERNLVDFGSGGWQKWNGLHHLNSNICRWRPWNVIHAHSFTFYNINYNIKVQNFWATSSIIISLSATESWKWCWKLQIVPYMKEHAMKKQQDNPKNKEKKKKR